MIRDAWAHLEISIEVPNKAKDQITDQATDVIMYTLSRVHATKDYDNFLEASEPLVWGPCASKTMHR